MYTLHFATLGMGICVVDAIVNLLVICILGRKPVVLNKLLSSLLYQKINSVVQWSENAMKSAIKERHHSKYHHQIVFHITIPSNILIDMTRIPLGTLVIKFRDSRRFIGRNRPTNYKL